MANFISLGTVDQLQIQIPRKNSVDWADSLRDLFFLKVVEHDHTGNGRGAKLGAGSFGDNSVTDLAIRLRAEEWLRSRDNDNTADLNIIGLDANDKIRLGEQVSEISLTPVNTDPISPVEGQLQVSDGTHRPAGTYTYVSGSWLSAPNNITASNQGAGEGIFKQKTGDDLELKTISAGDDISVASSADEVTISSVRNLSTTKSLSTDITSSAAPGGSSLEFTNGLISSSNTYILEVFLDTQFDGPTAGSVSVSMALEISGGGTLPILVTESANSLAKNSSVIFTPTPNQTITGNMVATITVNGDVRLLAGSFVKLTQLKDTQEGGF